MSVTNECKIDEFKESSKLFVLFCPLPLLQDLLVSAKETITGNTTQTLVAVGESGSDFFIDAGKTWTHIDTVGYHSISFASIDVSGLAVGSESLIAKFVKTIDK